MKPRALLALLAGACALAAVTACSSAPDDGGASDEGEVKTDKDFYGNDRIGKALKGHPELIPATLLDFEKLFKVGRACERVDSKEIFVVEESQTRLSLNVPEENMHDVTKTKLMPRAVITGCNTGDLTDPNSVRNSYSLFAALISDPNMHDSDKGDTMRMWPLEVMALDDTTGIYNFYVFEPQTMPQDVWASVPLGTPGKVTRIFRAKEDRPGKEGQGEYKVFQQKLEKGKAPSTVVQPAGGGKRCFNCHPNGAPLMNEIVDPWTNWVSFKSTLPKTTLFGETKTLVAEAIPNPEKGTSSLANDLEPIMRAGIQNFVFGPKSTKTAGWATRTLNGDLPGGLPKMLESVFCQTELNYTSASATVPMEVFMDPDVAALGAFTPPASLGDDRTPFQFPIRSVRDRETERWLVNRGYLEDADVKGIRLIDDENDIFSTLRCGLLKDVTAALPTGDPAVVRAYIRTTVKAKVAAMPWAATHPKRKAFVDALLTPGIRRETAQKEYFAELWTRYEKLDKTLTAVKAKERSRKARAREMFENPRSNPLPILDLPK